MFYGRTSIYERDYTFDLDFNIKKRIHLLDQISMHCLNNIYTAHNQTPDLIQHTKAAV